MNRRPSSLRPGFSLLEMTLATVIATLVLASTLSLLWALTRTDVTTRIRAEDSATLQRTRFVLQRAFSNVLVAPPRSTGRAPAVATPAGQQGADASGQGAQVPSSTSRDAKSTPSNASASKDEANAPRTSVTTIRSQATTARRDARDRSQSRDAAPSQAAGDPSGVTQRPDDTPDERPPRVDLDADPRLVGVVMERRLPDGVIEIVQPQRLEMVLMDSPVPTGAVVDPFVLAKAALREASSRVDRLPPVDESSAGQSSQGQSVPSIDRAAPVSQEGSDDSDQGVRAVRGVFEFRLQAPDRARQGDDARPRFELWWSPRVPRRTREEWLEVQRDLGRAAAALERAGLGEDYRIAEDLVFARFRVFDDRVRKEIYNAVTRNQLPAYVEMEVETAGGQRANWLFEVAWAEGPETRVDDASAGEAKDAQADAAGAASPSAPGAQRADPAQQPSPSPIRPASPVRGRSK